MTTFSDLGLHAKIISALKTKGFETPTEVQAQAIPHVIAGRDVMACAQTGTGKTAAFVLPALHRLLETPAPKGHGPRVLVLTPTRELSQQVMDNVRILGKDAAIRTGSIVGGVAYGPQFQLLRNPLDLLVATPGRLIDHLNENRIDFSRAEMVILDEADRMLDMGFLKPVQRILSAINDHNEKLQILLFSATFTDSVNKFAGQVLLEPARIELAPAKADHSQITQKAYRSDSVDHKMNMLAELLRDPSVGQVIVFRATKHGSDKLADKMEKLGHKSAALHGGMKQNARKRTLDAMHNGKLKVLVATDVAARGIDVKQLSHVINFDLPQVAEDYVHRIGRTGRAGETGHAISLIDPSDVPMLRDIEKLLGKKIELAHMEGFEPTLASDDFARQGAAAPRSRKGQFKKQQGGAGGKPQRDGERRGPSRGPRRDGEQRPRRDDGERSFRSDSRKEGRSEGRFENRGEGRGEGQGNRGGYGQQRREGGFAKRRDDSRGPRREGGDRPSFRGEGFRSEGRSERGSSQGGGFNGGPRRDDGFTPRSERRARPEGGERFASGGEGRREGRARHGQAQRPQSGGFRGKGKPRQY